MLLANPIVSAAQVNPSTPRPVASVAVEVHVVQARATVPVVERHRHEPAIDGLGRYIESRLPGQRFRIE